MVSFSKKIIIGLILVILLIGGFFLITKNNPTSGLFTATLNSNEIKIGSLLPLSGSFATIGTNNRNGMELAKQELIKENPNRKITFVFEDACYPKETIPAFTKLSTIDKVSMMGPSFCIIGFIPVISLIQKEKIIAFSAAASPDTLLNQPYIYSLNKSIKLDSNHLATFASKELNAKTAAIVFFNTQLGADYNNHLSESFTKLNGKILYSGVTEVERTDFRSELSVIKEKNPDVVYIIQLANSLGLFIKQARELGITSTIISQSTAEDPLVLSAAQGAAEGVIISSSQTRTETLEIREFKEKYFEMFNKEPDALAANAYDTTILQVKAYEKCNGEVSCIQNEINSIKNYPGASGIITMDSEGSTNREPNFKIVKNGKFVLYEVN